MNFCFRPKAVIVQSAGLLGARLSSEERTANELES